jgi:hypothetical protein
VNWHNLKLGDLIRGTYPVCSYRTLYLGVVTDREGDWLEVIWDDGDVDQFDLGNPLAIGEMEECWEVLNENR